MVILVGNKEELAIINKYFYIDNIVDLVKDTFEYNEKDVFVLCDYELRLANEDKNNVFFIVQFLNQNSINGTLLPKKIRLEASTICQLNCRDCYMRLSDSGVLKTGYLKFENFKKLIDDNPYIDEIELSNSGEIFLNPDLVKIMAYAYEKKVTLTAYNGVNFNTVTDEVIHALVDYQFRFISFSIDGASDEVYEKYRINGSYSKVIENIEKLIAYKKEKGSEYPKLSWQYVIMDTNELDTLKAKQKAEELGIPIHFKLTWNKDYKPVHVDFLKEVTGLNAFTREEHFKTGRHHYMSYLKCTQLFYTPQINFDGRLLGCCGTYLYDFDVNVFEVGLAFALKNEKVIETKKYLLRQKETLTESPCLHCGCSTIIHNDTGYNPAKEYIKYNQVLLLDELEQPFEKIGKGVLGL